MANKAISINDSTGKIEVVGSSGTLELAGSLNVGADLVVSGSQIITQAETVEYGDSMLLLNKNGMDPGGTALSTSNIDGGLAIVQKVAASLRIVSYDVSNNGALLIHDSHGNQSGNFEAGDLILLGGSGFSEEIQGIYEVTGTPAHDGTNTTINLASTVTSAAKSFAKVRPDADFTGSANHLAGKPTVFLLASSTGGSLTYSQTDDVSPTYTTIVPTDSDTTYSAGNGISLSTTTFAVAAGTGLSQDSGGLSLSHLGLESLSDPNDDRIIFWDDSASATAFLDIGNNLTITDTTIAATNTHRTVTAGGNTLGTSETLAFTAGNGITISESAGAVTITNSAMDTVRTVTAGGNTLADGETLAFTAGTNVTISESNGAVTIAATQKTQVEIEDIVGAMLDGTETLISVSYDATDNNLDFVVDNDLSNYDNSTSAFITGASTDTLTNKTFDADGSGNSLSNVDVADMKQASLTKSTDTFTSDANNDDHLPTTKAVKAYVDGQVTASSTANAFTSTNGQFIVDSLDAEVAIGAGLAVAIGTMDGKVKLADNNVAAQDHVIGICAQAANAPVNNIEVIKVDRSAAVNAQLKIQLKAVPDANDAIRFQVDEDGTGGGSSAEYRIVFSANASANSFDSSNPKSCNIKNNNASNNLATIMADIATALDSIDQGNDSWNAAVVSDTAGGGNDTVTFTATAGGNAFNFSNTALDNMTAPADVEVITTAGAVAQAATLEIALGSADNALLHNEEILFSVKPDGTGSAVAFKIVFSNANSTVGDFTGSGPATATIGCQNLTNSATDTATLIGRIKSMFDAATEFVTSGGSADWSTSLFDELGSDGQNDTFRLIATDSSNINFDFSAISTTNATSYSKCKFLIPGSIVDWTNASMDSGQSNPSRGAEIYLGNDGKLLSATTDMSGIAVYRIGYVIGTSSPNQKFLFSPQYITDM